MSYGFASNLRDALPKASFIGFTGTPIEKTNANTQAVVGVNCGAVFVDLHPPMIFMRGAVFILLLVKSRKSSGRLRSTTDFSLRTADGTPGGGLKDIEIRGHAAAEHSHDFTPRIEFLRRYA